jgi:hypothetical protein
MRRISDGFEIFPLCSKILIRSDKTKARQGNGQKMPDTAANSLSGFPCLHTVDRQLFYLVFSSSCSQHKHLDTWWELAHFNLGFSQNVPLIFKQ